MPENWNGRCQVCGATIARPKPSRIKKGRGRYCSKQCGGKAAMASREIRYRGTHGMSRTPIHDIWMGMRDRCTNPNRPEWKHYGGRGIRVCERWQTFENFLADMGPRPSPKHSVDRIDTNGDYSPENCRWVTQREQLRNTRRNHMVTYEGRERCVTDLAKHLGLKPETLFSRVQRGWPPERWAAPPKPCGPTYSKRSVEVSD